MLNSFTSIKFYYKLNLTEAPSISAEPCENNHHQTSLNQKTPTKSSITEVIFNY